MFNNRSFPHQPTIIPHKKTFTVAFFLLQTSKIFKLNSQQNDQEVCLVSSRCRYFKALIAKLITFKYLFGLCHRNITITSYQKFTILFCKDQSGLITLNIANIKICRTLNIVIYCAVVDELMQCAWPVRFIIIIIISSFWKLFYFVTDSTWMKRWIIRTAIIRPIHRWICGFWKLVI